MPLLFVLGLIGVVVSFNQRMLDPLTPMLVREIGVDAARIVALSPAFALPYALGQPFLGPIGDSYGKSLILKVCLVVLCLSSIGLALASDYRLVFALRLLNGLAAGGVIPTSLSLIGDRVPIEQRQIAYSRFLISSVVGQLFASPVSAAIAIHWNWHASALFAASIAVIGWVTVWQGIKPNTSKERPPLSIKRSLGVYKRLLTHPRALACYATVMTEAFCLFGFHPHVALYLEKNGFGSIAEAGYVIAGFGMGGILFSFIVGWVIKRFPPFLIWRTGAIMGAIGVALVPFMNGWPGILAAFSIMGLGFYSLHSGIQTQISEVIPEARGSAVALHACCFFLGYAVSPVVINNGLEKLGAQTTLLIAAAVLMAVGMTTAHLLERTAPARA